MRLSQRLTLLWAVLTISGCRSRETSPETPMPPNTILLSSMMRELSAQPRSTEKLLGALDGAKTGKRGPALLTPDLLGDLRERLFGKKWKGLNRFPGWTMREITPTVHLADHFMGKDPKLEGLSSVHPGSPAPTSGARQERVFLDVGPYSLDRAQTVDLDTPSPLPGFTTQGIVTPLGMEVVRGDGPNDLAAEHAASQRLADVLNRLSANALPGAKPFTARIAGHTAGTPEALIAALAATGHGVTVHDARYFANFGHLHFKGQDVMMPFWVNTGIAIPNTGGVFRRPRSLLLPVSHAELEWKVRGPHMNADVSHYFGVDGKAEWRTMDTLDQGWVLRRYAHIYTGAQAFEATRLIDLITVAYMHQHAVRPTLPFGGYYTLGVCQDPVSAVEIKLTGRTTLFPNTANPALFDDPRDPEVNALFAATPKDRRNDFPEPDRIFGSLPADPGADARFAAVTIPGLAEDLSASYAAWQAGTLERTHRRLFPLARVGVAGLGVLLLLGLAFSLSRRRSP